MFCHHVSVWLLIISIRLIFVKFVVNITQLHTIPFFVFQFFVVISTDMPVMRTPEVDVALVRILKFCVVVDFEKYRTSFT